MLLALIAAAMLAGAEPAPQAAPAGAPETAEQPAELKPGQRKVKMVCRTEAPTGSRLGKRVCMTAEDFNRRTEESRQGLVDMQRVLSTAYSKGN